MVLLDRLLGNEEPKLPVHQFMAGLAEYKRGAPGVTLAALSTALNLSAPEQADLAVIANLFATDVIDRDTIHDVLLLGEIGTYTPQNCLDRILTPGPSNLDPILIQHRLDVLKIGVNDFVLTGCAVTPQGSPDMTVAVAKGSVMSLGVLRAVSAGNVAIAAANAALPRLDLVAISSAGAKVVRQGTPSTSPKVTGYQSGDVPLAIVYVPATASSITADKMLDVRIIQTMGPITVGKITTPVVFANTSALQNFISLTLPSGLLLAGKMLRVNCGGTMLLNSGSPTVTLRVTYGGTTMFQDVTGAATADSDRLAWSLELVLIGQGTSDQALNGVLKIGPLAAKTPPTNGVGDISVAGISAPINGAAAINSDTGDRIFTVDWQMSVQNPGDEIAMEYATGELI